MDTILFFAMPFHLQHRSLSSGFTVENSKIVGMANKSRYGILFNLKEMKNFLTKKTKQEKLVPTCYIT